MTKVRVYRAAASVASAHVRVYRAEAVVPPVTGARVRVYRAAAVVPLSTSVSLGPDRVDVEPLSLVTVTAAIAGAAPTEYIWSVSDPTGTVVLDVDENEVTFRAPAHERGVELVVTLAVRNSTGATTTPVQLRLAVLPHTTWYRAESGWVPYTPVFA